MCQKTGQGIHEERGIPRAIRRLVYEGVVVTFKGAGGGYFQGVGHSVL